MKKLYLFFLLPFFGLNAQIEGMWRLAPAAGSLAVGPAQGSSQWWANGAADVNTRACLFDDSIKFEANGTMTHYMDNSTWLEGWQGSTDVCSAPVAPHVGGVFSYTYAGGALTVNGAGAHLGLPKVINGAEINNPANAASSITYQITFTNNNNTMTADIAIDNGNWWRFVYQRTNAVTIPNPNITFRVNMSNYTGSLANGVFVNGSFNNWCGACNPLTDIGNGVWQATLPIPAGNIEYKYTVNGFADEEIFAGNEPCTITTTVGPNVYINRSYAVTGDATLPAVCFESCDACPSNTNQIEGTWRLKPAAGSLAIGPNIGDGSWYSNSIADVFTRSCLFDDSIKFEANGTMTHYMDNSTWVEAWQGSPDACNVPVAPHVGGVFSYTYAGGALTLNGVGAHLGLPKVINGAEINNPANAASSITYQISFTNNDSIMIADINMGPGWWRFVYQRSNTVTLPDADVTFKVNMSNYTGSLANGVFVNGSFNNWCGTCNPMTDMGGGLWQATLPIPVGNIEYKYTVNGFADEEIFAGNEPCTITTTVGPNVYINRSYAVTGYATLPAVCFESCDACTSLPPAQLIGTWKLKADAGSLAVGPGQGNGSWYSNSIADVTERACLFDDSVKFEANGSMTHYMDNSTWVENWQGGAQFGNCGAPVAPHVGGAYAFTYSAGELTINGAGGHLGLAKAYNGNELGLAGAVLPTSRTYQIAFSNNDNVMTVDIAVNGAGWWRFIYEKTQVIQAPTPMVTFKVDMNNYAGTTPTNVSVFGNFNGWNSNANPMTDANTDGIWETTLPIAAGPIEYKFFINNSNVEEQFIGGEPCTVTFVDNNNDVFVNRSYTVVGDADLDTVCFESCNACTSGINEQVGVTFTLMPNPAQTSFNIVSSEAITEIELVDLSGKSVRKVSGTTHVNVADLVQGMYTVIVRSENGTSTSRMIVE